MKVVVSFFKKLVGIERFFFFFYKSRHGEAGSYIARHRIGVWWRSRLVGVLECLFQCKIWFSQSEIFFFNFKQCLHQNNTAPYYFIL